MSGWQYARYKARKEASENTAEKRCERWRRARPAHETTLAMDTFTPAPLPAQSCPCDDYYQGEPEVSNGAPPGCAFLALEDMDLPPPQSPYQEYFVMAVSIFCFLLFLISIFIYRKYRRDEAARILREQRAIEMRIEANFRRRQKAHSGKCFVEVQQPGGECELAEILVVDASEEEEKKEDDGDIEENDAGEEKKGDETNADCV